MNGTALQNNSDLIFDIGTSIDHSSNSITLKRSIICLGTCTDDFSKSDEKIEFMQVNSVNDLINIVENWDAEGFALPEALIIEHSYIAKLNAEGFSTKRKKSKLNNTVLIVVSQHENELVRHGAYSIGADDYCFGNIDIEDVHNKISFLKPLKSIGFDRKEMEFSVQDSQRDFYQKRFFDIMFATFALLISLPFLLLIAILIKLESKGPVFYVSKRAGFGFSVFDFYKFRTMVKDADKDVGKLNHLNQYNNDEKDKPSFFKVKDDPRVTKIGKILRNTSLDELPQLINVLKGDMSIVGNRPLPLYEAQQLTSDDSVERFLTCSGLTGLWQVLKRGSGEISNEERIQLDKIYARKSSLWFDLKIIIMTFPALLQKESV